MSAREANFDGLVGPTHAYGGLSFGNVASTRNRQAVSDPRAAARQGLAKMKALADRGFVQCVLPPHERPDVATLRQLGFAGSDADVIRQAGAAAPALLAAVSSASAMWTANAATVSPSADTRDGRVHFTPANLNNKFHRAIESAQTRRTLSAIFADTSRFAVHDALPAHMHFGDEGAANHGRLCATHGAPGVELFVYGARAAEDAPRPALFPARQTREASEAVARLHGLDPERVLFVQQRPETIDQGVFHNDVISVANGHVLFCHERAFLDQPAVLDALAQRMAALGTALTVIEVPDEAVTVADAVSSYLFNSQLLTREDGRMTLVVPRECRTHPRVRDWLDAEVARGGPIAEVLDFDLRESMQNGGGPACLRLRVVLTEAERAAMCQGVRLDDALHARLDAWIGRHYRDRLCQADLADPALLLEVRTALDELTGILGLGSIYPFQLV